uniref:Uncharacterized protein n=1 Tax=Timema douglasi TaxID=61478 RepID=A0A7R8Z796_TIMDO|nr:unnamed protein product [Timema douglasi]
MEIHQSPSLADKSKVGFTQRVVRRLCRAADNLKQMNFTISIFPLNWIGQNTNFCVVESDLWDCVKLVVELKIQYLHPSIHQRLTTFDKEERMGHKLNQDVCQRLTTFDKEERMGHKLKPRCILHSRILHFVILATAATRALTRPVRLFISTYNETVQGQSSYHYFYQSQLLHATCNTMNDSKKACARRQQVLHATSLNVLTHGTGYIIGNKTGRISQYAIGILRKACCKRHVSAHGFSTIVEEGYDEDVDTLLLLARIECRLDLFHVVHFHPDHLFRVVHFHPDPTCFMLFVSTQTTCSVLFISTQTTCSVLFISTQT